MTNLEKEDIQVIAASPSHWEKLKDRTLLMSGGTGFIGSLICDVIRFRNRRYGDHIRVVSLSRHGGESDDTVLHLKADITRAIPYDGPADFILHLASNTHPAQYAADPVGTIMTNLIGCDRLLKMATERNTSRFLLASSVEIYGQGSPEPMDEGYGGYIDCNTARAGYNESKRTCEALCQSYRSQYGVNCVTARLARTFGADRKKDTKAMAQFIQKAAIGEDIVLKSTGNQRYSYAYVADTVSGIFKVLLDGRNGEAYNVSDEDEGMTLGDYAGFLASMAGTKVVYDIEDSESVSKATYALLKIDKLKSLGWSPAYTVREGLQRTCQIYKARRKTAETGIWSSGLP